MARAGDSEQTPGTGPTSILLLGAGELGKELAISAQRMGLRVVAADRYDGAPAMQVAHASEVLSLLDSKALEGVIRTHRPDLIFPELEAVSVETLIALEKEGFRVVPNASAAALVADRMALRAMAAELGLRTPRTRHIRSREDIEEVCDELGYPVVVKPLRSSSGRGQTVVTGAPRLDLAWQFAVDETDGGAGGESGGIGGVVAEEYIAFHSEVTLLAIRDQEEALHFLPLIAHRQDRGGFRESWLPATADETELADIREMATRVMDRLGGTGLTGLEFFLTDTGPVFSEISLGPHDTGMVTLVAHDLSQFDLHLRAVLGLTTPVPREYGPAAAAVILADREGEVVGYSGIERALQVESTQLRIFGKPRARPFRRMGVALATGDSVEEARARALEAAARVRVLCR